MFYLPTDYWEYNIYCITLCLFPLDDQVSGDIQPLLCLQCTSTVWQFITETQFECLKGYNDLLFH